MGYKKPCQSKFRGGGAAAPPLDPHLHLGVEPSPLTMENHVWYRVPTQQNLWCENYTTGVNRGPHHAFYTGVKFAVLVQHPVVLF